MKPIQIFVRHCYHSPNAAIPGRKRPEWFSKEACWENLYRTMNHEIADVTVIYDNHFGELKDGYKYGNVKVNVGNFGTEASSFLAMLELVKMRNFPPHTIIYFVEDDYLHRAGWCEALLQAFTLPIHYATLYDHEDKYKHYPDLASHIFARSICHWRTTPSTTNTYACKMMQLAEDMDLHERYSTDTATGVTNDCAKFEHLGRMGRVIVSPIPGFSTHCDDNLSPTIDWEKISNYTTY